MSAAEPFAAVTSMEEPFQIIADLSRALALIAETLQEDEETRSTVQRLAWMISDQVKSAEVIRRTLFRLTHPSREHFERTGWPTSKGDSE